MKAETHPHPGQASPDPEIPSIATWSVEEGDSSMRITIVHSGFSSPSEASRAMLVPVTPRVMRRHPGATLGSEHRSPHLIAVG